MSAQISINPFKGEGKFYKGCLHCHTNNSDGMLPPEEVAEIYKKQGYGFLAITDHNYYTDLPELSDENFILIPGIEYCTARGDIPKAYHFLGLRADTNVDPRNMKNGDMIERPDLDNCETAQKMIDFLKSRNNDVILCHTVWSRNEIEEIEKLDGFFAMEIYTHLAEYNRHLGLSVLHWDTALRHGRKIWGIATDDAHHKVNDHFGGWVVAKVEKLTGENIINALKAGRFYSSTGPEIYRYEIIDGEVFVECSPVESISFMIDNPRGVCFRAAQGEYLTAARYKLDGRESFVRVECIDMYGKTAWTNPIFVK